MMTARIAATTFVAFVLSLAAAGKTSAQSVGDPVPLLNGTDKAKVLFSVPFVRSNVNVATCVSCSSTEKGSAVFSELVALELFDDGFEVNDLTSGEGVAILDFGGDTESICTRNPASVSNVTTMGLAAETVISGVGRVVATTKKLICTAYLVPVVGDPPGFMTMLPLYKGSKQKGGM